MIIRMIKDTIWHDEGKGFFKIPAGTEGRMLTKPEFYSPHVPIENHHALFRANKRYKEIGRKGVWVYLAGKYRFCDAADCRYVGNEE